MKYNLSIREHNIKAHLDIEKDLGEKRDGLFSFVLRINGGNIVDYVLMEQEDGKNEYGSLEGITIEELSVTRYH